MHASSCGNVDRAILYAEKALQIMSQQSDGMNLLRQGAYLTKHAAGLGVNIQVFDMLRSHVMETMISCKIIEGKYTESLNLVCHVQLCTQIFCVRQLLLM